MISQLQNSLLSGVQSLNPTQGSPTQSKEMEKRALVASGDKNQWGLCPPGRKGHLLEIQTPPSQSRALLVSQQPGEYIALPSNSWCHHSALLRPYRRVCCWHSAGTFGRSLFLEKFMAETQTVIELCSFGKGTILFTSSEQQIPPPPVILLGLPFCSLWPCSLQPRRGIRVPCRAGSFGAHFPGKLWSRNQMVTSWVVWLYHGAAGALLSPLQAQPMLLLQQDTHLTCLFGS